MQIKDLLHCLHRQYCLVAMNPKPPTTQRNTETVIAVARTPRGRCTDKSAGCPIWLASHIRTLNGTSQPLPIALPQE